MTTTLARPGVAGPGAIPFSATKLERKGNVIVNWVTSTGTARTTW